jgi:hypothetical protein
MKAPQSSCPQSTHLFRYHLTSRTSGLASTMRSRPQGRDLSMIDFPQNLCRWCPLPKWCPSSWVSTCSRTFRPSLFRAQVLTPSRSGRSLRRSYAKASQLLSAQSRMPSMSTVALSSLFTLISRTPLPLKRPSSAFHACAPWATTFG